MAELNYREAVAYGIAQEMRRDPNLVMLGEDIAAAGGVFKTTVGLVDEFGPDRVRDTPISEQALLGAAMGAAMTGVPVSSVSVTSTTTVISGRPTPRTCPSSTAHSPSGGSPTPSAVGSSSSSVWCCSRSRPRSLGSPVPRWCSC